MSKKSIRVTTDVGGTFTDLVCFESDAATGSFRITTAKAETTPPNFDIGVLDVIAKAKISPEQIDFLAHGTTVVINALTERKGARVGLITTDGFRDVLEIARGNRPDFFNLGYQKPAPFVPRHLRAEIRGRTTYRGDECEPLDLDPLPTILAHFRSEGVEAVAICLLHAYADPAHEKAVAAEVKRLWQGVSVVASHQITREWREYERTSTTVLSAYVQPVAERYLFRLRTTLRDQKFRGRLFIMQSNCGVDSVDSAAATPITMIESGPSSGFWGAAELGRQIGHPDLLALDIGGTTAKCSLIAGGQVRIKTDYWVERDRRSAGYPIMVPVVDLVEIGNGGGSVAWVDEFRRLHVGPRSAGASPGPAAYGRGGTEATTTDANLKLGRINPNYFCGGTVVADMAAVERALAELGAPLGMSTDEVARGIIRIANNNMVNALKLISQNRGFDPRDFTLVAFGGGGAMHAAALGAELGVRRVVIPASASVFSAWGMLMSDLRHDYFATRLMDLTGETIPVVQELLQSVESGAVERFEQEGFKRLDVTFQRFLKLRYQNQEHTTEIPIAIKDLVPEDAMAIEEAFRDLYKREYTYRLNVSVELVGIHVVASVSLDKPVMVEQQRGPSDATSARKGSRWVDYALEGLHEASIYEGEKLSPGMRFSGPAVVEESGTTVLVHPGNNVEVDGYRHLHIDLSAEKNG